MNKKEFQELTGEDPEDILGGGWEDTANHYLAEGNPYPRVEIIRIKDFIEGKATAKNN